MQDSNSERMESFPNSLEINSNNYRKFVGPVDRFDVISAIQFNLLTFLGLRENHSLLDIGCGCLRAGRLLIVYLSKGNYTGVEAEKLLVDYGVQSEIGQDLVFLKTPTFIYKSDWMFASVGRSFDYLLAQSVFSHASRRQISLCLKSAAASMHNSSLFCATFFIGTQDYQGESWVYPQKVSYRCETILSLIREAGLIGEPILWEHPTQTWYLMSSPGNYDRLKAESKRIERMFSAGLTASTQCGKQSVDGDI